MYQGDLPDWPTPTPFRRWRARFRLLLRRIADAW